jgi:hypothetical protein
MDELRDCVLVWRNKGEKALIKQSARFQSSDPELHWSREGDKKAQRECGRHWTSCTEWDKGFGFSRGKALNQLHWKRRGFWVFEGKSTEPAALNETRVLGFGGYFGVCKLSYFCCFYYGFFYFVSFLNSNTIKNKIWVCVSENCYHNALDKELNAQEDLL